MVVKKIFFYFFTLLALMCSCSEEMLIENVNKPAVSLASASFSFDSITCQDSWRSSSIQQKFDACQIPDSIISTLSTEQLVELCASYPLNPLCYAYDNPMIGALYIMQHFNGFKELQKRSDAAEKLICFYENVNFTAITSSPYPMTIKSKDKLYSSSNISFIEFILASDEIPSLNNSINSNKLNEVSYSKFEEKLNKIDIYGITNVNNTLMIQSKVALKSNKFLSKEDKKQVQDFYNNCGRGSDINEVTKILFLTEQKDL